MKAITERFRVVPCCNFKVISRHIWNPNCVSIQMKTIRVNILFKAVLIIESRSVDKILKCGHLNES